MSEQEPKPKAVPQGRRLLIACSLLLVLVGIGASVYLTDLHVKANTDASYAPACDVNATWRCTTVAISHYSVFLDVPVAAWGLLGYGIFLILLVWGLLGRPDAATPWPTGIYWLLCLFTLLSSAALAYIAEVVIGALCLGCLILYIANFLLFVLGTVMAAREPKAVRRDLRGLTANFPLLAIGAVGMIAAAAIMLGYRDNKYWEVPIQAECDGLATGAMDDGSCWVGAREPVLTITEFSDYRCPYCRRAHARLRDLVTKYPDRIRLIHKHYPLDMECNPVITRPFHHGACLMARMAYCAAEEGQFWKMNDALFSLNHEQNPDPSALAYELGMKVDTFMNCMDSAEAAQHVKKDIIDGMALQISATPSFLIDGKLYEGKIPEEVLNRYLNP